MQSSPFPVTAYLGSFANFFNSDAHVSHTLQIEKLNRSSLFCLHFPLTYKQGAA